MYGRFYAAVALVTVGVVATVVLAVYADQLNRQQVVAELDASRRWVTLSRVHPDFVAAVLAHSPSARTQDS